MDQQPSNIDNSPDPSQNEPKNENINANDDIVIRLDELTPLNDPNCDHNLEPDDDTIGDTRAWKCSKCHRGVFLPKNITKVT